MEGIQNRVGKRHFPGEEQAVEEKKKGHHGRMIQDDAGAESVREGGLGGGEWGEPHANRNSMYVLALYIRVRASVNGQMARKCIVETERERARRVVRVGLLPPIDTVLTASRRNRVQ